MLEYRILGPLEVSRDGLDVEVSGPRQRAVLVRLLLSANRVVSSDVLVDQIWGPSPPARARDSLLVAVGLVRQALGDGAIETRAPGYLIHVDEDCLDLERFQKLVRRSRTEPPEARARTLNEALALWRGDALADMQYQDFAQEPIRTLGELRIVALHEHLQAENACGRHADGVAEATGLADASPTHEGYCHELMLALYRCGRQDEAVRRYHALRKALDEATGQRPGAELKALYDRIISHDVDRPEAVAAGRRVDRSTEMHQALAAARLVPVLGPRSGGVEEGPTVDPAEIAAQLARMFDCPSDVAGSLARVAQHIAITRGVGPLHDALSTLYGGTLAPCAIHRALAALPPLLRRRGLPCQLILSSGYDCMLERAFGEAGEEVDVVSYVAHGRDRGKFLHVAPGGAVRIIHEPNLEIALTPGERTVILKLNGGVGELSGRDGDGYVVSEDDYIDYLTRSEPSTLLPIGLAKSLRRSHLLFMGYELDEWSLRVFLRRLWGGDGLLYRSWALDPTPKAVSHDYWRPLNVDVLADTPQDVLERLRLRLADGDGPAVPA
jgi:DNA-binding SARP family transcriptional activator